MKVIVNLPEEQKDIAELEDRVVNFHATLLLEEVKQLNINDNNKEKILKLVLKKLKDKVNSN